MEKKLECLPNWYIYLFMIAYILPFSALVIYTIVVLLMQGFLTLIGAFLGSLVIGGIVFFPFICMYYAVLTFIHTLVDELIFRSCLKKKCAISIIISFVCSAFLALNSILTIQYSEHKLGWVPFVFMLISFFTTCIFFARRNVFKLLRAKKDKEKYPK